MPQRIAACEWVMTLRMRQAAAWQRHGYRRHNVAAAIENRRSQAADIVCPLFEADCDALPRYRFKFLMT